jgi:hypothetical protein
VAFLPDQEFAKVLHVLTPLVVRAVCFTYNLILRTYNSLRGVVQC